MNQKGFASPLILFLLVSVFMLAGFWIFTNDINVSSSSNVHGAATPLQNAKPGLGVSVISSGTWDLYEYLCTTKAECTQSLQSGKRFGTISGGATSLHSVEIENSPEWEGYSFLKLFVKSGGQNNVVNYKILGVGDVPESSVVSLSDGGVVYNAVIIPLNNAVNAYFKSATFTD